jgi:hypothetical protein
MKRILAIAIIVVAMLAMPTVVGDPTAGVGNDPDENSFNNPNGNPMCAAMIWADWFEDLEDLPGFSEFGMGSSDWGAPNYGASDWAYGHNK